MVDILVSHIDDDYDRVQGIVKLLERHNWSVWWNKHIQPGDSLDIATEAKLETAKVVITAWSAKSVLSRLVRNTAFEAIEVGCWIPIRFEAVKLPLRYRHYQTIDISAAHTDNKHQIEDQLVQRCRAIVQAQTSRAYPRRLSIEIGAPRDAARNGNLEHANMAKDHSDNDPSDTSYSTVPLGEWTIEEGQNRIVCEDRVKRITPRSMQVLMLLIEHRGRPVSIEKILGHVWRDRVVVESVVHRCIKELRDAFEDNFKHPRYIETIAKRGYRIVTQAPIEKTT